MDILFYNTNGKLIRKFKDVDYENIRRLQREYKGCGCWYEMFDENDEQMTFDNYENFKPKYIKVEGTIENCKDLMFWSGLTYRPKIDNNFEIDEETKDEIRYFDKDRFKDIYNEIKQSFKRAVTKGKFVFSDREYPNDYAYWCITYKEGNETYDFIVDDFTPNSGREMSDFPKFKDVVEMSFWSGAYGEVYKKKGNFSLTINSGFLMF